MSPLGQIVDIVRMDMEFVEDSPRTRLLQRMGKLFCLWVMEVLESVRTYIFTSSTTTRGWSSESPYKLYILQCAWMEMVRGSISRWRNLFHEKPMTALDK